MIFISQIDCLLNISIIEEIFLLTAKNDKQRIKSDSLSQKLTISYQKLYFKL